MATPVVIVSVVIIIVIAVLLVACALTRKDVKSRKRRNLYNGESNPHHSISVCVYVYVCVCVCVCVCVTGWRMCRGTGVAIL